MLSLDQLARTIAEAPTGAAMWTILVRFAAQRGIRRVSYHHYLPHDRRRADAGFALRAEGFPSDWVCRYLEARLYAIDPIPALAMSLATPFLWSQTASLGHLTASEQHYLELLAAADLGDGLAVPVFGPAGRDGYVGLGFGGPAPRLTAQRLLELQMGAQMGHLAYCAHVDAAAVPGAARLSPREREVLDWVARGKTNAEVALILSVSEHTVATYLRRIFRKLGVNDRVSATVRGLGGGRLGARP